MGQGGIGYSSTSALPRRLEVTAPADPIRGGAARMHSGQRPGTSGQAAGFTDRPGNVYNRQGAQNEAKASNKMP